jgi:hypothetical protein
MEVFASLSEDRPSQVAAPTGRHNKMRLKPEPTTAIALLIFSLLKVDVDY